MDRDYNFYSKETGEKKFISEYTISYGISKKYKDKHGKEILDSKGNPMLFLERKVDWSKGVAPAHILGSSKSDVNKRVQQLKNRSKEHYKKRIDEKRYEMNKSYVKKFKEQ